MQNRNAIESLSSNKSYKNKQLFITFITYNKQLPTVPCMYRNRRPGFYT